MKANFLLLLEWIVPRGLVYHLSGFFVSLSMEIYSNPGLHYCVL